MSLQLIRPDIDIDFVGKRYFFVVLSSAINLAAVLLLIFVGLNYGVDFVGGSVVQIRVKPATAGDQIRQALAPLGLGEIQVQDFGNVGHEYLLRFEKVNNIVGLSKKLEDALNKAYGPNQAEVVRVESVGSKVSKDLRSKAIGAVAVATLIMGAFIAYQFRKVSWSFGTGAVIALIHDVLV